MPIYDYECSGCAHRFEMKRTFSDTDAAPCPLCGCSTQRIFSSVPIIFKGAGFYVTDHRKDSSSPPATPPASPPAGGADKVKAGTEGK